MSQPQAETERCSRVSPRLNLYLSAILERGKSTDAVTVRNLSTTGALLESRHFSEGGAQAALVRGSLRAEGKLIWAEGPRRGIHFDRAIDLNDWLAGTGSRRQTSVDRKVAAAKTEIVETLAKVGDGAKFSVPHDKLVRHIAEELSFVARKLDLLGSHLVDEPVVIARHSDKLQQLDISSQILVKLSLLLLSEEPSALMAEDGMEDLRRRLTRRSLT